MNQVLLPTAYLPNLHYFRQLLLAPAVTIETQEHYVKQTYRNRCEIYSANGLLSLTIPLVKQQPKELISGKKIAYGERWQNQHWRAITSAYKNSPYFEYFEDDLRPYYETQFEHLFDYNDRILKTLLNILRQKKEIAYTTIYQHDAGVSVNDLRAQFNPGQQANNDFKPYYQVFSAKHGFIPNLSLLDLLFNEGLNSVSYLAQS